MHSSFWSLAALAFPEARAANLLPPLPSPHHNVSLPPDDHIACFDYLYYVCVNQVRSRFIHSKPQLTSLVQPFEFEFDYSPAWRYVGQHVHFTPRIKGLADSYIRKAIGIEEGLPTPPVSLSFGIYTRLFLIITSVDCDSYPSR